MLNMTILKHFPMSFALSVNSISGFFPLIQYYFPSEDLSQNLVVETFNFRSYVFTLFQEHFSVAMKKQFSPVPVIINM